MNRRILILSLLAVMLPVSVSSQIRIVPQEKIMSVTHPRHSQDSATLSFDTRHIVAERMNEDDVPRSFIYRFVNVGEDTLKIQRLLSTCSCASAVCTRNIVPPAESAEIRITYDPKGHPGRFERKVFVYTIDDAAPAAVLRLSVDVAKGDDLSHEWPVPMGDIRVRRTEVRFAAGEKAVETLRFINVSDGPLSLECEKAFLPDCLTFETVPAVAAPGEEGMIRISFNPSVGKCRKQERLILKGLGLPPSQSVINIRIE